MAGHIYQNHTPNWKITSKHIDAALLVDSTQDGRAIIQTHQCVSVNHIQAVKNIGVYGNHNSYKSENIRSN